jgi:hypothetical protein
MLASMRAYTQGARALAYYAAKCSDLAHHAASEQDRARNASIYEFLVPIIKGFSTEMSIQVASLGVQVHGGMGFIEETGAAQYYRDARILSIYEGTTAIQANDLVGRKTFRDKGAIALELARLVEQTELDLASRNSADSQAVCKNLRSARLAFESVVHFVVSNFSKETKNVFAGSVPYLMLSGYLFTAWQLAKGLIAAENNMQSDQKFYAAKVATARFHAEHLLPQALSLAQSVLEGGASVNGFDVEYF